MQLLGIDFTSAPRPRKPITVARGSWVPSRSEPPGGASGASDGVPGICQMLQVRVEGIDEIDSFEGFEALLAQPGPWVGAFDFPFGLPRELVLALGWPTDWRELVDLLSRLPRPEMVAKFRAFCADRPPGGRFAHRACDIPAGSSPSMKWVNPPVAFMLQAGAPRLLAAGVCVPGLGAGDEQRVALEGYPGMLARHVIGRASYKNDAAARLDPQRRVRRQAILAALEQSHAPLGAWLELDEPLRQSVLDDGQGDRLDALLCLALAAWAARQGPPRWGLPERMDPVEGWIVGVAP